MNSGIAVIIGAVIALTGSAVVPWIREALADRREQKRKKKDLERRAVVSVLAANQMAGFALQLKNVDHVMTAMQERSTAAAELLISVPKSDRSHMARLLARAVPVSGNHDGAEISDQVHALQVALVSWVNDEITGDALNPLYEKVIGRAKRQDTSSG